MPPTIAESRTEAQKLEADIADRIEKSIVPPKPDFVLQPVAWQAWYDNHIRCATPEHWYRVRERGRTICKFCIATGVPEFVPMEVPACTPYEVHPFRASLAAAQPIGISVEQLAKNAGVPIDEVEAMRKQQLRGAAKGMTIREALEADAAMPKKIDRKPRELVAPQKTIDLIAESVKTQRVARKPRAI